MKKSKLDLKNIRISSFVTRLPDGHSHDALGGANTRNPTCDTLDSEGPTRGIILCTGT